MFAFVAPGCILAVFGVAMLWPWSALPRVPSRRSYDEQRRSGVITWSAVC